MTARLEALEDVAEAARAVHEEWGADSVYAIWNAIGMLDAALAYLDAVTAKEER